MRSSALATSLVIVALAACKTDDARPTASPAKQPTAGEPRPTDPKRWRGLSREVPVFEGARTLVAPRSTPNNEDVFTSFCFETKDPQVAATRVAETLRSDGWDDVTTRGTGAKLAVGARAGDRRISVIVGGADASCTGLVATATVVRIGQFTPPPPLEDGEKIR